MDKLHLLSFHNKHTIICEAHSITKTTHSIDIWSLTRMRTQLISNCPHTASIHASPNKSPCNWSLNGRTHPYRAPNAVHLLAIMLTVISHHLPADTLHISGEHIENIIYMGPCWKLNEKQAQQATQQMRSLIDTYARVSLTVHLHSAHMNRSTCIDGYGRWNVNLLWHNRMPISITFNSI